MINFAAPVFGRGAWQHRRDAVTARRLILAACAALAIACALGLCAACLAIHHPEDGTD